ncbi:MAG TPA: hypothetical protein VGL55_09020 [Steroidobacteraceae bacterium]|jgi:hypothetical protein
MSSSYRNLTAFGAGLCSLSCWMAVHAQEVYWQPQATLTGTYNTNVELTPVAAEKQSAEGYIGDLASLIGIATPTSQTTLRPDIRYEYYPQDTSLDRLEGFLDVNSQFSWQRDRFSLLGRADRLTDLSAEQPDPQFNQVNPGLPTTPTTGRVVANEVRNEIYIVPNYSHSLTPLSSIGLSGTYQRLSYSPDDVFDHVDYNYYQGRPFVDFAYNQRTLITFGAFASHFEATNIDSVSKDFGGDVEVRYNWSPIFRSTVELLYQRTTIDQVTPTVFSDRTNNWGATFETQYTGQADRLKLSLGRSILPSSAGSLYNTDQIQLQYDHDFTARLSFTGAVLYQKIGTLASNFVSDSRSYATTGIFLRWLVTPVLFVKGGYSYVWQKYQLDPNSAANNQVLLQFGYLGRGRQR